MLSECLIFNELLKVVSSGHTDIILWFNWIFIFYNKVGSMGWDTFSVNNKVLLIG